MYEKAVKAVNAVYAVIDETPNDDPQFAELCAIAQRLLQIATDIQEKEAK